MHPVKGRTFGSHLDYTTAVHNLMLFGAELRGRDDRTQGPVGEGRGGPCKLPTALQ